MDRVRYLKELGPNEGVHQEWEDPDRPLARFWTSGLIQIEHIKYTWRNGRGLVDPVKATQWQCGWCSPRGVNFPLGAHTLIYERTTLEGMFYRICTVLMFRCEGPRSQLFTSRCERPYWECRQLSKLVLTFPKGWKVPPGYSRMSVRTPFNPHSLILATT